MARAGYTFTDGVGVITQVRHVREGVLVGSVSYSLKLSSSASSSFSSSSSSLVHKPPSYSDLH